MFELRIVQDPMEEIRELCNVVEAELQKIRTRMQAMELGPESCVAKMQEHRAELSILFVCTSSQSSTCSSYAHVRGVLVGGLLVELPPAGPRAASPSQWRVAAGCSLELPVMNCSRDPSSMVHTL